MDPGNGRDPVEATGGSSVPYVISFAGIPGSGKTMLLERVRAELAERDLAVGTLPGAERIDREPYYRSERPGYWRLSRDLIDASVEDERIRQRRARWWFVSTHRADEARTESIEAGQPVLLEEAMIHEVWRLSHWLGHRGGDQVTQLAGMIPPCELIFHVRTSAETARRRIKSKGEETRGPVNRALAAVPADDALWDEGLSAYEHLLDVARTQGEVVGIDNDADEQLEENVAAVLRRITPHARPIERGWLGRSLRSLRGKTPGR